uniref:uncharacterized protein LOC122601143 n=1 Tax=Erigeron canadensis TaxID=72917 RepID=UPI001CB968B2|nr:uncharacterized protein LOC122601143 [Erigeron canadensis]
MKSYFKQGIQDTSQPSVKCVMQTKEKTHDTDLAIALWFYDSCIPMNVVNSPLFPIAMSKVASMGHGYTWSSYHSMRVTLLKDAKTSVSLIIAGYRKQWEETGCTIMSDGWRDARQRPLINFMVYCSKGVSFIKSVDASGIESNAHNLCNLFGEIVEFVGPQNVVHLVTDNAANYKAAGRLLSERYPSICWSPCAAHCINMILKDVSGMPHVSNLITLASRVTVFIYNHKWPLNWLRNREGWSEIIRPGATRFGTSFIALKSLYDHRSDLEALVISSDYQKMMSKLKKARDVKQICLDQGFWKNCLITLNVMSPLLKLLCICDSDEKPSLGYVYEGSRAKQGIEKLFRNKKDLYKPYTDIIDTRWDNMLRKNLHAAAYWLNPVFQYDEVNFKNDPEVMAGVLAMVSKSSDAYHCTMELNKFGEAEDSFGMEMAATTRKKMRPGKISNHIYLCSLF